jgi:transcriptional regulator with PAS, ATPase and Fis domain
MREFRINVVRNAIAGSNGNKSLAAKKLGLSRAYLHGSCDRARSWSGVAAK